MKNWNTWIRLIYRDNRWYSALTDEHMRRIFRPEAARPAYWVNGPQIPAWHWSIG